METAPEVEKITCSVTGKLNTPPKGELSQPEHPGCSLQKLSVCAEIGGASLITSTVQKNSDGLHLASRVFKRLGTNGYHRSNCRTQVSLQQ